MKPRLLIRPPLFMTIWGWNERLYLFTYELSGLDTATKLMKRERAFLGLGSTYRVLGEYQKAEETLRRGLEEFPQSRALQVFLALALYNTQKQKEAMELVLTNLLETTSDETLQYYKRGLLYYASHLDEIWE